MEKRRSVTMDSPEIAKDSDKSEDDKIKKGQSKTVGDIEGSATSPVKVHVPMDTCMMPYLHTHIVAYIYCLQVAVTAPEGKS